MHLLNSTYTTIFRSDIIMWLLKHCSISSHILYVLHYLFEGLSFISYFLFFKCITLFICIPQWYPYLFGRNLSRVCFNTCQCAPNTCLWTVQCFSKGNQITIIEGKNKKPTWSIILISDGGSAATKSLENFRPCIVISYLYSGCKHSPEIMG